MYKHLNNYYNKVAIGPVILYGYRSGSHVFFIFTHFLVHYLSRLYSSRFYTLK